MADNWRAAVQLEELKQQGACVVRIDGRQLAVFWADDRAYACNNRCPHEGYPLVKGTLSSSASETDSNAGQGAGKLCLLTCNWHNWKFALDDGANQGDGERLRVYPTRVRSGRVEVELSDPPLQERVAERLLQLDEAINEEDAERIARELARLERLSVEPRDILARVLAALHDRMQYGMTHAVAGVDAWLRLRDEQTEPVPKLVCLLEPLAHLAHDCLRQPQFAFVAGSLPRGDAGSVLLDALQGEDESRAVAALEQLLQQGTPWLELERLFSKSALMHYADFGHSLIYTRHCFLLIERLGGGVARPLLRALLRQHIYASREDLIPEFQDYAPALEQWGRGTQQIPAADDFAKLGVKAALTRVVESSSRDPEQLYRPLLGALADRLYRFDVRFMEATENPVADNVSWLGHTHGITFANAVRQQCQRFGELWPRGLLQMACFVGRNVKYRLEEEPPGYPVTDGCSESVAESLFSDALHRVLDHAEVAPIFSVHLLKTTLAAREEWRAGYRSPGLLNGLHRYVHSPMKRRHVWRTAHQALRFVSKE